MECRNTSVLALMGQEFQAENNISGHTFLADHFWIYDHIYKFSHDSASDVFGSYG